MKTELEKTKETNDLGYPEVDARKLSVLGKNILVQWEFCQDKLRVGKYVLLRPDTHKKMHYVGNVMSVGEDVSPEIQPGCRIVFDQFSDIKDKFWDRELGRVALLSEEKQGALFMIVPPRVEIEGQEPEYDYSV